MEIDDHNWTSFTFWLGASLGAVLTLQVNLALAEYRHKRQLHRRLNRIEARQNHQGTHLAHLQDFKQQTKKQLRELKTEAPAA